MYLLGVVLNMCGIFVALYDDSLLLSVQQIIDSICPWLSHRGHDWVVIRHYKVRGTQWSLGVIGCVLHLRGKLTPQPAESDRQDWLLWNGEAYNVTGDQMDTNDTTIVLDRLSAVSKTEDILRVLSDIRGPWSLIYYQEHEQCLWFGRDSLGRRSLVKHIDSNLMIISSIGIHHPSLTFHEVSAIGVFRLFIGRNHIINEDQITCYPWKHEDVNIPFISMVAGDEPIMCNIDKQLYLKVPFQQLNKSLPLNSIPFERDDHHYTKILRLLEESVMRRITETWKGPENIGILYSGGLDSVVLAAITDRCLDKSKEIDLINVAFSCNGDYNAAPDRITAIQSLQDLNNKRRWNLILVDVDHSELCKYRSDRIHHLIYPLHSVLDDSIGSALWFAARGKGSLYGSTGESTVYQTNCKILLVGMGADEQFGGYSRHRTAYTRGGWRSVIDEVNKDICRISTRNLGRDDRCISDHHREARYPYLDEAFVDYMNSLPMWIKTDYTQERGVGEKLLLRQVASSLGCTQASQLPKRAIQFGSRIAKTCGTSGTSGQDSITLFDKE